MKSKKPEMALVCIIKGIWHQKLAPTPSFKLHLELWGNWPTKVTLFLTSQVGMHSYPGFLNKCCQ